MTRRVIALIGTVLASVILMAGVAAWSLRAPPRASATAAPAGQDLEPAMRTGKPTVAEFGANACASCREMKVVLGELKRLHGDRYGIFVIDIIQQQEYIARHRIQLMPTQVFFDAKGREVGRHMGKLTLEQLVAQLEKAAANPS
jgi:thioredoxin 1